MATLVQCVPVKEIFEGRTAWADTVGVFNLARHPTATRAYAWARDRPDAMKRVRSSPAHGTGDGAGRGCESGYRGGEEGEAMKPRRASYKQWAGVGVVLGVALTLYHLQSISAVSDCRIWLF